MYIYKFIYFFPSRTSSRSELSEKSDTDESLKQTGKKRKKKKKHHHHSKKTKKKTKGDSSSSESDVDTKHIKDKGSGKSSGKEAAARYVFINTMQDVNSLSSCDCLFN